MRARILFVALAAAMVTASACNNELTTPAANRAQPTASQSPAEVAESMETQTTASDTTGGGGERGGSGGFGSGH